MNLKAAQETLQTAFPNAEENVCFMGVSAREFEKTDLIRMIAWSHRDCERMQESADRDRRMRAMFAAIKK